MSFCEIILRITKLFAKVIFLRHFYRDELVLILVKMKHPFKSFSFLTMLLILSFNANIKALGGLSVRGKLDRLWQGTKDGTNKMVSAAGKCVSVSGNMITNQTSAVTDFVGGIIANIDPRKIGAFWNNNKQHIIFVVNKVARISDISTNTCRKLHNVWPVIDWYQEFQTYHVSDFFDQIHRITDFRNFYPKQKLDLELKYNDDKLELSGIAGYRTITLLGLPHKKELTISNFQIIVLDENNNEIRNNKNEIQKYNQANLKVVLKVDDNTLNVSWLDLINRRLLDKKYQKMPEFGFFIKNHNILEDCSQHIKDFALTAANFTVESFKAMPNNLNFPLGSGIICGIIATFGPVDTDHLSISNRQIAGQIAHDIVFESTKRIFSIMGMGLFFLNTKMNMGSLAGEYVGSMIANGAYYTAIPVIFLITSGIVTIIAANPKTSNAIKESSFWIYEVTKDLLNEDYAIFSEYRDKCNQLKENREALAQCHKEMFTGLTNLLTFHEIERIEPPALKTPNSPKKSKSKLIAGSILCFGLGAAVLTGKKAYRWISKKIFTNEEPKKMFFDQDVEENDPKTSLDPNKENLSETAAAQPEESFLQPTV